MINNNNIWIYYEYNNNNISRIEYMRNYNSIINDIVNDSRITDNIKDIFNEDFFLLKDKINFKYPNGEGFKSHQDITAGWHKYSKDPITVAILLDESTIENGCLQIWDNDDNIITDQLTDDFIDITNEISDKYYKNIIGQPGDIIVFDAYIPHKSDLNKSNKKRRILYLTYSRKSDGDNYEKYHLDKFKNNPPDKYKVKNKKYRSGNTFDMRLFNHI